MTTEDQPMKRLSEEWWAERSPEIRDRRCHATRRNGVQCTKVALAGQRVCGTHGGFAPQAKAKARQRLEEAADRMAARLLGFAVTEGVPAYVALAATQDALDRAGLKPPTQVEVGAKQPWEEVVADIQGIAKITRAESRAARGLPALAGPTDDEPMEVVDAEVLDPDETHPSDPSAGRTASERPDVPPAHPAAPTSPPGRGLMTMEDAISQLNRNGRR